MPSVLFVCTANRFRSPLAAAIFVRALDEEGIERGGSSSLQMRAAWRVDSAGTWAAPGEPVLPLVADAARKLGIDLSDHTSRRVNESLLSEYDLILVMTRSQKEALQSEFPALQDRIYLLSHVVERGSYDIPDISGSEQEVEDVISELNTLIRGGVRYIRVLATYLHNTRK